MHSLKQQKSRSITIALCALFAIFAIASFANAAGSKSKSSSSAKQGAAAKAHAAEHQAREKETTYIEAHLQRDGKAVVARTDFGKVKSVSADQIVVTENDGNDVTIKVDSKTQIHFPAKTSAKVTDIAVGRSVMVRTEDGGAALAIGVKPTAAELAKFDGHRGGRGHGGPGGLGGPGGHGGPGGPGF